MKILVAFLLLACSSVMVISCKKQKTCETARLCVVNGTADTVRYCWGCNTFSEKVAPGEKACRDVRGPIEPGSTVWVDFETPSQTRRIEVAECDVEVVY